MKYHTPFCRFNSLNSKLLTAIIAWVLFLFIFIAVTINITWKLEDRAIIINQASQLPKKIYRLTTLSQQQLLITDQLNSEKQKIQLIFNQIKKQNKDFCCQLISSTTDEQFIPLELSFHHLMVLFSLNADHPVSPTILLQAADNFAQNIDLYINNIEQENTRVIQVLRTLRLVLISIIILSAVSLFFLLKKWVLSPLKTIHQAIKQVTGGQLSTRTHIGSRDEFAMVSEGFNKMTANLEDIYQNLEKKVTEKTEQCAKQNENWAILHHLSSYLHANYTSQEVLKDFLNQLIQMSHALAGAIHITEQNHWTQITQINMPVSLLQAITAATDNNHWLNDTANYFYLDISSDKLKNSQKSAQLLLIPIYRVGKLLGVLSLYIDKEQQLDQNNLQLLVLLCTQLGITIENMQLMMKEKQHAVLEERHLMAQGLHDSIAQSLTFLNLQIQLLTKAANQQQMDKLQENLSLIQDGIQYCYNDVRELLTQFRTKLLDNNLLATIESIINHYQKQMGIPIHLFILSDTLNLNPEQQLQVIFILQEALANTMKHAKASSIEIVLEDEDDFRLVIKDDGHGFIVQNACKNTVNQHIGLLIMQERAAKINAKICINSAPNIGTTIELLIPYSIRKGLL